MKEPLYPCVNCGSGNLTFKIGGQTKVRAPTFEREWIIVDHPGVPGWNCNKCRTWFPDCSHQYNEVEETYKEYCRTCTELNYELKRLRKKVADLSLAPTTDLGYYFGILGLPLNASKAEIKKAFKRMSVIFHPDNQKTGNAEMFRLLVLAKDKLCEQ